RNTDDTQDIVGFCKNKQPAESIALETMKPSKRTEINDMQQTPRQQVDNENLRTTRTGISGVGGAVVSNVGGSAIGIECDLMRKFRETNVIRQLPGRKLVECKPMRTLFNN